MSCFELNVEILLQVMAGNGNNFLSWHTFNSTFVVNISIVGLNVIKPTLGIKTKFSINLCDSLFFVFLKCLLPLKKQIRSL